MRRIALISEHASPLAAIGGVDSGGQNIYVAHVARQLGALGHVVDVFTRREDPSVPQVVPLSDRVTVVQVPAGPARVMPKEALLPHMPAFSAWLLEYCRSQRRRRRGYDVLHANFFMSGMAAMEVKRSLGIPVVITFHALGKVRRLHQGASDGFPDERFAIEEELVRRSDRIVAECPQDREDLLRLYDASAKRVDVVPCGFDAAEFFPEDRRAARAALGWDERAFCVLQLGRLVARKGVDNVIRGVAELRRRGANAQLYVVGGNTDEPDEQATPEIARLRALASEANVADCVHFTGRRGRADLRRYYSAADVFVSTPWYEPFGITPVEAMACACPVVGSAVGGIRTTVEDGVTGLLVPARDPAALAARLAELMANPARARAMGEAGRARAQRGYTWAGVAQRLDAVYGHACDQAGRVHHLPGRKQSDRGVRGNGGNGGNRGEGRRTQAPVAMPLDPRPAASGGAA